MSADQTTFWTLAVIAMCISGAWGWFSDKSLKIREDDHNRKLREDLAAERVRLEHSVADARGQLAKERKQAMEEIDARVAYVTAMRGSFNDSLLHGRKWLASYIAEADRAHDEAVARRLKDKAQPALKAADEIAAARAERRRYKERATFLEYQLLSLKEYFPFIEEYEEELLNESISLGLEDVAQDETRQPDPIRRFLSIEEFDRLSSSERSQLALDRWLTGPLGRAAIGRLYEHYIGHLMELDGWAVEYHGIMKGFEDMGRDLLCTRGSEIKIVQAKCWSKSKVIHEKHIFQLFGTTHHYRMEQLQRDLFEPSIAARFVTSTSLSPVARQAATLLNIEVDEQRLLRKDFPMIKCNVNQQTAERIYHLPFDQQYERTAVLPTLGECYALTAAEAEAKGFRRAFRHRGAA